MWGKEGVSSVRGRGAMAKLMRVGSGQYGPW
jgi:hypothetical protein